MAKALTENGRLVAGDGTEELRELVFFCADTPNNVKISILLEELAVPYDVILVDIMANAQKKESYLAMNPNGRTPTLLDRSVSPPFAVFESGAILLYLADKFQSPLLPRNPTGRSEAEQWLMWQMSGLGPMMGQANFMKRIAPAKHPFDRIQFSIDRFQDEQDRLLQLLDARLAGRDYICGAARGAYTIADIAIYGYPSNAWWYGIDLEALPNLARWLKLVGSRPAVVAARGVPGISVLGPNGPTAHELQTNRELQIKMEESAASKGKKYFGWPERSELAGAGAKGATVFGGSVPDNPTATAESSPATRPRVYAVLAVIGVVGAATMLARRANRC